MNGLLFDVRDWQLSPLFKIHHMNWTNTQHWLACYDDSTTNITDIIADCFTIL